VNGALTVIYFFVVIALYAFGAYCLQAIAKKLGVENDWFAWVPILNIWLAVQIAGRDVLWFVLCLIPCVNFVAMIIIFMDIAEKCGRERTYGILMIVPLLNLWVLWQLAFGD